MNTIIGPLGLTDRFGTNIGYYDLVYDVGMLDILSNVAAMLASVVYQFFSLPALGLGIWLTDIATKPQRLFAPLENFYEGLIGPVFEIVPFPAVAVLAVSVLFLFISFEKKATTSNLRRDTERVIIGMALAVVAIVLARNPFTPMRKGFEVVQSVVADLFGATSSGQITVDSFLLPLTQITTYGAPLSGQCSAQWSQMLASGQDSLPCADSMESVGFGLISLSIFAIFPAAAFLAFAGITIWKTAIHLFHATWRMTFIPFAMLMAIFQRRRFDVLTSMVGTAVAHYLMTVVVVFIALVGPGMATGLLGEIVGDEGNALRFTGGMGFLLASYAALSWAMLKITSSTGALAKLLRISGEERLERHYGTDVPARNIGEPDKVYGLLPWTKNGSTNVKDHTRFGKNKKPALAGQTDNPDPNGAGSASTASDEKQAPGGLVREETATTAYPTAEPADQSLLHPTTGQEFPATVAKFRQAEDDPNARRVRSLFRQEQSRVVSGSILRGRIPGVSSSSPGMNGSAVLGSTPSRKPVVGTATAGARLGAKVGSVVPGVGTGVGTAVGAVGGAALATTANRKSAQRAAEQAAAQVPAQTPTARQATPTPPPVSQKTVMLPPVQPGTVLGGSGRSPVPDERTAPAEKTQAHQPPAPEPTPDTPASERPQDAKPAAPRPYSEQRKDELRRDEDLISGRTVRRTPVPESASAGTSMIPSVSPEKLTVDVRPTAFAASVPDVSHAAAQNLSVNDMRMASLASGYGDFAPVDENDPISEVTFVVVGGQNRVLPIHDPGLGR